MDTIKPLFTATATATGGRNGHTEASDGSVGADLSVPKAMGGPGKPNTSTPEHLFAAGYAACFGGAIDFVGKQHKKNAANARRRRVHTLFPNTQRQIRSDQSRGLVLCEVLSLCLQCLSVSRRRDTARPVAAGLA